MAYHTRDDKHLCSPQPNYPRSCSATEKWGKCESEGKGRRLEEEGPGVGTTVPFTIFISPSSSCAIDVTEFTILG